MKAIIVQNRWTKLREKMADEEQMVKVHEMEDNSNADVLTFNPGGKYVIFLSSNIYT